MVDHSLIFSIFLIFAGAAVLSTIALLTRQSMLVAYIFLGILLGPFGIKLISDIQVVHAVSDVGIMFLLFLLGLNLPPQKLWFMLKKISRVSIVSTLIFGAIGYLIAWWSGYTTTECLVVGASMTFSSTIIGIKLLPTTILHHQHTGEVMISVLLLQDLFAIAVLLFMQSAADTSTGVTKTILVLVGFPLMVVFAYFFERIILVRLFYYFNRIKEYLFLIAIAWCLSLAQLAALLGLSSEIGAFIAGVSLAASPISIYIAESLKPIRDFFLVMFFFSVGASFNLGYLDVVIIPALILVALFLGMKPVTFHYLLRWVDEPKHVSWEVGVRLAQISEFSLIIAYVGLADKLIGYSAAYLIEATTILSFIVSSYWVVLQYPTPMAMSDRMRKD